MEVVFFILISLFIELKEKKKKPTSGTHLLHDGQNINVIPMKYLNLTLLSMFHPLSLLCYFAS